MTDAQQTAKVHETLSEYDDSAVIAAIKRWKRDRKIPDQFLTEAK